MRRRIAIPLLMLMLAGCASAGGKETSSSPSKPNRDRNLITAAEIDASHESSAYLLIQALRPNMLVARGSTSITLQDPGVVVFLDNQRFGNVESLKSMQPTNIAEIRYLSPSEAQSRWGLGFPQGVIHITTSRRGR
jgi:hypothetical protein